MAQIQKMQCETELKCSADKFYVTFKNNMIHLPQHLPEIYKSIQVLEGDGQSLGTVRIWKYVLEGNILTVKEKVEAMDDKNRSITFKIIGGDVLNLYQFLQSKFDVTPITKLGSSDERCLVKWSVEYEKANKDVPAPDLYLNLADIITKEMTRHLI